jgi:adenine-specific DNA-methyltransferase
MFINLKDMPEICVEQIKNRHVYLTEDTKRGWNNAKGAPTNLLIEGENYHALRMLEYTHTGKVDVIYIDPPYNTGNKDFVYSDDFSTDVPDGDQGDIDTGSLAHVNPEDPHRHSKWASFMVRRLRIARNLLSERGVIFISIDDHEMAYLKLLCDAVFGEDNFVANMVVESAGHTDNQFEIKVVHEYVLMYARNKESMQVGNVIDPNTPETSNLWKGYAENTITKNGPKNPASEIVLPIGFPVTADRISLRSSEVSPLFYQQVEKEGYISREVTKTYQPDYPIRMDDMVGVGGKLTAPCRVFSGWANANKLRAFIDGGCVPMQDGNDTIRFYLSKTGVVYYRRDRKEARNIVSVLRNLGTTERARVELEELGIHFSYPKPRELVSYLIRIGCSDKSCVVLDFFAGSGTTGQAVAELNREDGGNRQFILVTNNEKSDKLTNGIACDVTYPRLVGTIKDDTNLAYMKVSMRKHAKSPHASEKVAYLETDNRMLPLLKVKFNAFEEVESTDRYVVLHGQGDFYLGIYFSYTDTPCPLGITRAKFQSIVDKHSDNNEVVFNVPSEGYATDYFNFIQTNN